MNGNSDNPRDDACPVDRCMCFDHTFECILDWCRTHEAMTLEAIRDHFGCGRGCGLCVPYLKEMLRTGRVRFGVMTELQFDPTEES